MTGRSTQRGLALVWWLVGILAAGALLFALHVWIMLSWSYSSGERAGWVQKLSKKGYLCKTWEGEMAMVSLPGSVPEKFYFTVWDDGTAAQINELMGRRVSLHYDQHIWLPTNCFGETRHFVKRAKLIEDAPAPLDIRSRPGSRPASPAQPDPQQEQAEDLFEEPAPDAQGQAEPDMSAPLPPRRPRPDPPPDVPET
jgi:hypothetical protein